MLKDNQGREPLYDAIESNNLEIVKLIINSGVRVNVSVKGFSYLMQAYQKNNIEIFEELLRGGAKLDTTDLKGQTVEFWAMEDYQEHFLELFQSYRSKRKAG